MYITKKALLGLLALMLVFGNSLPGQANDKKQDKPAKPKAPIVIEGDEVSFSDLTGEVFAKGNVKVTQDGEQLVTDLMHGNTKQYELWADGSATFTQPGTTLTGTGTHYNYQTHAGTMQKAAGMVGRERVTGKNMEMFPDELIAHNGTMTACPAKVPDYHISADKVEIWPGDKMIAYNAKFWIKNKVIFSMPKYQTSLRSNDGSQSQFPRIGYNSNDGFFIKQYMEYPLTNNIAAFSDLAYSTKANFRPNYGLIDRESKYSLKVVQGYFQDSDNNWIKKQPEFDLLFNTQRIGTSPLSYTVSAIYGKWVDSSKSSWHQDYSLYFSRDPIKLGSSMSLSLGTGIEEVRESFNGSSNFVYKFDSTVNKQWSPKFNSWVGYHYTRNNPTLFAYNQTDLSRELDVGFTYKIDRLNSIGFSQSYDLVNNHVYDQDYTWYRNLHCWQADITWRARRHQLIWNVSTIRW